MNVGFFNILYFSGMLSKNSCIVYTHLRLLYASAIMLHSIQMIFTLMIFIGTSDSCHCRDSNTRSDENLNNEPIVAGFRKIYSIDAFDLVVLFSRNLLIVLLLARITSGNSSSLRFASWECKISRFKYHSILHSSYGPSGMTIFSL